MHCAEIALSGSCPDAEFGCFAGDGSVLLRQGQRPAPLQRVRLVLRAPVRAAPALRAPLPPAVPRRPLQALQPVQCAHSPTLPPALCPSSLMRALQLLP